MTNFSAVIATRSIHEAKTFKVLYDTKYQASLQLRNITLDIVDGIPPGVCFTMLESLRILKHFF